MLHQVARGHAEIAQHLHRFSILQLNVLLLTAVFVEVIVDELPKGSPPIPIGHDQQVVSTGDQVRHVRHWSIAVNRTPLIDQIFHEAPVGQDDCRSGAHLQGEYPAIPVCPLRESTDGQYITSLVNESVRMVFREPCLLEMRAAFR